MLQISRIAGRITSRPCIYGCNQLRQHSYASEKLDTSIGKDGHYDIIIVGGGGAGISLAGAIGKNHTKYRNFSPFFLNHGQMYAKSNIELQQTIVN